MIKIDDKGSWRKDVAGEIRRLEHLLFDLNSLWSGPGYPSNEEMARAQVIWRPVIEPRAVPSLMGLVGSAIKQTSPIVLLGDTWARTWHTLYRIERD